MHKDNNIGKKFVCLSARERIERSKELSKQGYEFETTFRSTLLESVWIIKVVGYKGGDNNAR